jgi:long-chain acyl-CoA synthetase
VISETNAELVNDPKMKHLQIQRFILLPKRLDVDDGEVTRLRKVRRDVILQRYASFVKALYDGSTVAHFDAPAGHNDGSADHASSKVKIGHAQIFATSPSQKAA